MIYKVIKFNSIYLQKLFEIVRKIIVKNVILDPFNSILKYFFLLVIPKTKLSCVPVLQYFELRIEISHFLNDHKKKSIEFKYGDHGGQNTIIYYFHLKH